MISNELQQILDSFNKQGKMNFLEAIKEDRISEFEKEHSIKLPAKFREWLMFSDGGELFLPAGVQLYGVEHKPFLDVSDNSRPTDDYIVIGAFATGDPILCKKGEETISIYNQEIGEIDDELVFSDFVSFLKELYELLGIGE